MVQGRVFYNWFYLVIVVQGRVFFKWQYLVIMVLGDLLIMALEEAMPANSAIVLDPPRPENWVGFLLTNSSASWWQY